MKIKHIATVDFRNSALTIFRKFYKGNRKFVDRLKSEDVLVFISRKGNQLLFTHGFTEFACHTALMSVRHNLLHGTWNPRLLVNYAEAAGLYIEGLKRFEDYYSKYTK